MEKEKNPAENSDLVEQLKEKPIEFYEKKSEVTKEELLEAFPGKKIVAVDFYIKGIEKDVENEGGFQDENFVNIDHHAPIERMIKQISSTNLAMEYVKKHGIISNDPNTIVVINHADCDSVLASAILRGILPPEEKFGEAAIAADHTGKENKIADLLQSFDAAEKRDLEFSLRNLQLLLEGKSIEKEAQELLANRYEDRKRAERVVNDGKFHSTGQISWTKLDKKISGELLPALLPDAKIIMLASPLKSDPSRWEIKLRLGMKALDGLSLKTLMKNQDFDPVYGGRWNAGANNRPDPKRKLPSGTTLSPEEYAKKLDELLEKYLSENNM